MAKLKATARAIRLVQAATPEDAGVFCIRDGKRLSFYAFHEIPCDVGGRGFAVHKLGLGTLYHLRVGLPEECDCECMGWLAHGICKHVLGLQALLERGLV